MTVPPVPAPGAPRAAPPPPDPLRRAAVSLEASFLAQMLGEAGLGRVPSAFGGEIDTPFASFLVEAQARRLAEAGGIGLAESILRALSPPEGPPPSPGPAVP